MGKNVSALALVLLSACAEPPVQQAVAPSLPPASIHQVTVLDVKKCVLGTSPSAMAPCVIDLQAALKATPEAREFLTRGYSKDAPEYYLLLNRANERMRTAIRRVAGKHGFDLVMERGSVVLRADQADVMIADITNEVAFEVSR
jgi:hypothetical protein